MSNHLSDRIKNMSTSATLAMAAKARELRSEGKDIIGLSLGEPDFNIPDFIKEAAKQAIDENNLKEVADALTDILYVTYGAGHAFGIDLDKCFLEVQRSNMSKLGNDGKPIYNEEGKVMKGPKYFKPNLNKFLK